MNKTCHDNTYPGMPTVPKAKDSGNLSGHSAGSFLSPLPSEMECDVQPAKSTTTVPVGKAGFLLSTTLEDKKTVSNVISFPIHGVRMLCRECSAEGIELSRP